MSTQQQMNIREDSCRRMLKQVTARKNQLDTANMIQIAPERRNQQDMPSTDFHR
jgi:hypothetical protein